MSGFDLVAGAYGVGNLGDEAMLAGYLTTVDPRELKVFSRCPPETAALHGIPAVRRNLRDLLACRSLTLAGGELFQPGMAWKYAALLLAMRALGKRARAHGVGVSPKLGGVELLMTRMALARASTVSVRDAASQALLASWDVNASRQADLATLLDPDPRGAIVRAGRRPLIGLNLRGTYDAARDRHVMACTKKALARLFQTHPYAHVLFLAFTRHRDELTERDDLLGEELEKAFPGRVELVRDALPPARMLGLIASLDVVISMRFHPLVFALRARVPALALRQYWKVEEFAREHAIPVVEADDIDQAVSASWHVPDQSTANDTQTAEHP